MLEKRTIDNVEKVTEETLEEFSIVELDDRLEFTAWCDSCKAK
jgi:hypothetical protein